MVYVLFNMAVTNSTELAMLYSDQSSYIAVHDVYMQLRYIVMCMMYGGKLVGDEQITEHNR